MRGKILSLILIIISAGVAYGQLPADSVLRRYAAQMLMVGFKGDSINDQSDAARYVRDLKVGAIVLFDVDLTGDATIGSRNVTSTGQLATLTRKLQSYADYPLLSPLCRPSIWVKPTTKTQPASMAIAWANSCTITA